MPGRERLVPNNETRRPRWTRLGIANEVKTYEGAPHSFFDRSYEEHAEASADAWQRILAFVEKNK